MEDFSAQSIDLSQLDLVQEGTVDNINPDADFGDAPPPVPDPAKGDFWVAVPKLINFKGSESPLKTTKDSNNPNAAHLMLQIEWELSDTRLEGSIWQGNKLRTWPSTRPGFSGTSEVDSLLRAYTGKAGVGMSRMEKIKTVLPFLQAASPVGLVTEWRSEVAQPTDDNPENTKIIRRGMAKHPIVEGTEANPVYKHIYEDVRYPNEEVRVRAHVTGYRSVS
jgi:hypothetical protein